MAREPSAHYKAIASEVEMLRKRESSNMRRIKALEDKMDIIMDILRDSALLPGGKLAVKKSESAHQGKADRAIYEAFNKEVAGEFPGLISVWSVKESYGFASEKTVMAIFSNAGVLHEMDGEIDGVYVKSKYVKQSDADELMHTAIAGAIVCLETEENGAFKGASLKSNLAAKNGSPGKFRMPENIPASWVNEIAEREALRECKLRSSYAMFIDGYANSYGRALGMDRLACQILIDDLIHSGKILLDGNTIKAA